LSGYLTLLYRLINIHIVGLNKPIVCVLRTRFLVNQNWRWRNKIFWYNSKFCSRPAKHQSYCCSYSTKEKGL